MITHGNFSTAISWVTKKFMADSEIVHTERWQGVDISKKPDMAMHELRHVYLHVPMPTEQLGYYQTSILPNLPWADDHFDERVCGQPINPGIQWAKWPWGHNASKFLKTPGPYVTETDWAYLAALIDADGSITFPTGKKPHVVIHQVDHEYLRRVQRRFEVGQLREQDNNSGLSDRPYLRWQISAAGELKWLLCGVLKYIKLKREEASRAFNMLPDYDMREVGNKGREPAFNHNYMQRYWPKYAGMTDGGIIRQDEIELNLLMPHHGIYHPYGDLNDVVDQLVREPLTRQAILPVFFPEDTGAKHGDRIPCSLHYQFFVRNNRLDIVYALRSCDLRRHFRDDLYLTVRLALWVLQECRKRDERWRDIGIGDFIATITSLHVFRNDFLQMQNEQKAPITPTR